MSICLYSSRGKNTVDDDFKDKKVKRSNDDVYEDWKTYILLRKKYKG